MVAKWNFAKQSRCRSLSGFCHSQQQREEINKLTCIEDAFQHVFFIISKPTKKQPCTWPYQVYISRGGGMFYGVVRWTSGPHWVCFAAGWQPPGCWVVFPEPHANRPPTLMLSRPTGDCVTLWRLTYPAQCNGLVVIFQPKG